MKKLAYIFILIFSIAILSGCTILEMDITIDEHGVVYSKYTFAIKQDSKDMVDVEAILLAAQGEAEGNGFTVNSYDREDYHGFTADKSIEGLDLDQPGSTILGFDELPSIFKDLNWQHHSGVFEDHYSFSLLVDLNDIVAVQSLDNLPSDLKEEAYRAINESSFDFNITMMGKPIDTNADNINENRNSTRYSWTLDYGEEMNLYIDAVHDKASTENIFYIILFLSLILAALILTYFFLYKKLKQR